ncbi:MULTISPECIES: hypothetical protein [Nostocales]|uniref:Uncharacterized protein n=2 Tax=Nostocales TaxID=1161 RepID=A0ABW8WHN1_9CYAN|nr:hypothetical protein [Tolypothrix bouteillei]
MSNEHIKVKQVTGFIGAEISSVNRLRSQAVEGEPFGVEAPNIVQKKAEKVEAEPVLS